MKSNLIHIMTEINEVYKNLSWIAGEYVKMFPSDPSDLQMVNENTKMYCATLYYRLSALKATMNLTDGKFTGKALDLFKKLEKKLKIVGEEYIDFDINDVYQVEMNRQNRGV